MSYKGFLSDGSEIFIPDWPVTVALQNLTKLGKAIPSDLVLSIAEKNIKAVIAAILNSPEPVEIAGLIKHFTCAARINGQRIVDTSIDSMFEGNLHKLAEIFSLVVHTQYHDFFALGLAEEASQPE